MNVFDFARYIPRAFFEMLRLMIDGVAVAAQHPVHGPCCAGEICAIVIRPGEENRYDLRVSIELKEGRANSVHIVAPETVRAVKDHDTP